MHNTKLITSMLLIMAFAGISITQGSELQKKGFSVSIPDGWVEMPREVIDAWETEITSTVSNAPAHHFDYGFQSRSSKNWFEPPYILVQIQNTSRFSERQLNQWIAEDPTQESARKLKKVLRYDFKAGKTVFDKQNNIVWSGFEAKKESSKPISIITAMILTEKGYIQVNGYSLKEAYQINEPVFQSIAQSITPEPGLVYKPKLTDNLPPALSKIKWGKAIESGIIVFLIFGIGSLIGALRRKKKKHIAAPLPLPERICPKCGTKYKPDDYNPDSPKWLCSTCKTVLPR